MNPPSLTGRISSAPSVLVASEVLDPQFRYEAARYLPWYVQIEKAQAAEYARLGLITPVQAGRLGRALDEVAAEGIAPSAADNMSDISFAVELAVVRRLPESIPIWHVDRSRNDLQACAQLLFGRDQIRDSATALADCIRAVLGAAERYSTVVMPGYTHLQSAQVMTPGFYLTAVADHLLRTLRRLLWTYDEIDRCPLGAGAMTGSELAWDRDRLAQLLGFAGPQPHALVSVASRSWMLEVAADCANLGLGLGRFVTDLMAWGGSAYRFIELPDELAGISSAMPQKKNYPILERIRGRSAHLTTWYLDLVLTQRATAFGNSVEVAKEGGSHLADLFGDLQSMLRLFTVVVDRMTFDEEVMLRACADEYLGGFSLANRLALTAGVPWREAQVLVGEYIVAAVAAGAAPSEPAPGLLVRLALERGIRLEDAEGLLDGVFTAWHGVAGRRTAGSTHPDAVADMIADQRTTLNELCDTWELRRETARRAGARLDGVLGLVAERRPAAEPAGAVSA